MLACSLCILCLELQVCRKQFNEVGAFINLRNLELDLDLEGIQVRSGMEVGIVTSMLCCSGMMRVAADTLSSVS